jgi:hypothetical protein
MDEVTGLEKSVLDDPDRNPFTVLRIITGIATELLRSEKYRSDSVCNQLSPPQRSDSSATSRSRESFQDITS